jgi:hypothetical protein
MIRSGRVVFFASALALAATPVSANDAAATPTTVTGTIQVVGTITIGNSIPANATFFARAGAGAASNNVSGSTAQVTRSGATATVTFAMPYVWTISNPNDLVSVFFNVSASWPGGTAFPFASASIDIPLPPNGSTRVVKLPAAI